VICVKRCYTARSRLARVPPATKCVVQEVRAYLLRPVRMCILFGLSIVMCTVFLSLPRILASFMWWPVNLFPIQNLAAELLVKETVAYRLSHRFVACPFKNNFKNTLRCW
jgi:hypothetical protein